MVKLRKYMWYLFIFLLSNLAIQIKLSNTAIETSPAIETNHESPAIETNSPDACLNVTHPHAVSDCHNESDGEYSCCYVYIELGNHNTTTECYPVKAHFDFVPMFISEFDIGGGVYKPAKFTCKSDPQKTCSTGHPKNLDDCSLAGSEHTSCCIFTNRTGETNCVLSSHYKFEELHNYTYLGNFVECAGRYFNSHIYVLFFAMFLLI